MNFNPLRIKRSMRTRKKPFHYVDLSTEAVADWWLTAQMEQNPLFAVKLTDESNACKFIKNLVFFRNTALHSSFTIYSEVSLSLPSFSIRLKKICPPDEIVCRSNTHYVDEKAVYVNSRTYYHWGETKLRFKGNTTS